MAATGIDIGGTKILAQRFAADWRVIDEWRVETPRVYGDLIQAVLDAARWAVPGRLGVATAGIMDAQGRLRAANLASDQQPFARDLRAALGTAPPVLNDARALALAEARLGAGRGYDRVLVCALGTGLGCGYVAGGRLAPGQAQFGGEVGHMALPLRIDPELPRFTCGCGQVGCVETLVSGRGRARLARHFGEPEGARARAWQAWTEVTAMVLADLCLAYAPEVIVLGGGAAQAEGLLPALEPALGQAMLMGLPAPALALSQGGTPALGAALLAAGDVARG